MTRKKKRSNTLLVAIAGVTIGSVLLVIAIALLPRKLEYVTASGSSMEPAVCDGDILHIDKDRPPVVGDVVIACPSQTRPFAICKRIVALGGDTVEIVDGEVFVNGASVGRTSNLDEPSCPSVVLASGEVYVLGDNRDDSDDSASFGPIRIEDVVGVVDSTDHHLEVDNE